MTQRYCTQCGKARIEGALFCRYCGVKFQSRAENRKPLTKDVIDKDLHNQRHSFGEYLWQALLVVLMIVVVLLGQPLILICGIFLALNVSRMIREDVRRSKLKYYVLERVCVEKRYVQDSDSPDVWQLWFENRDRKLITAVEVEKAFYEETREGEAFYVVFLEKDKTPCLCYRKSQWSY